MQVVTEEQYDQGYRTCSYCHSTTLNYIEGYDVDIVCEKCQTTGTIPEDCNTWHPYENLFKHRNGKWHTYKQRFIVPYHSSEIKKIPESIGDVYCGFELEIVPVVNRNNLAIDILDIGNLTCEEDSSLDEGGFEIISNYGDLDTIINLAKKVSNTIGERALSHDTECCGLHIHLTKPDSYICAKMSVFWNDIVNKDFIKNIARRYSQDYAYMDPEKNRSRFQNKEYHTLLYFQDKYGIINIKESTIEIRAFKGTTKLDRLLANIETAWYTLEYCKRDVTASELNWKCFVNWLEKTGKSKFIFPYLDSRISHFNWRELECV
jgi:hypothetical protein